MEPPDAQSADSEQVLRRFARAVDAQDWDALTSLLSEDFQARYVHTGETFSREGFVAANRDYPSPQRFTAEEVVAAGEHAVLRARVEDASGNGVTYYVASFATVRGGRVERLVEVWTDQVVGAAPAHRAPPAQG